MVKEFISQLPPDKLSPFEKHPYQVREDAAMDELVESIRVHGVLSPLLARPKGECYELVSGHRQQSSEGKPAAQRKGIRLQDEVGGNETPRKINFGATRTEVDN